MKVEAITLTMDEDKLKQFLDELTSDPKSIPYNHAFCSKEVYINYICALLEEAGYSKVEIARILVTFESDLVSGLNRIGIPYPVAEALEEAKYEKSGEYKLMTPEDYKEGLEVYVNGSLGYQLGYEKETLPAIDTEEAKEFIFMLEDGYGRAYIKL